MTRRTAGTNAGGGGGSAWYVATLPDREALSRLASHVVDAADIELPSAPVASGGDVEVVRRGELTFVINHGADAAQLRIEGTDLLSGAAASGLELPSQGVAIVRP